MYLRAPLSICACTVESVDVPIEAADCSGVGAVTVEPELPKQLIRELRRGNLTAMTIVTAPADGIHDAKGKLIGIGRRQLRWVDDESQEQVASATSATASAGSSAGGVAGARTDKSSGGSAMSSILTPLKSAVRRRSIVDLSPGMQLLIEWAHEVIGVL